MAKAFKIDLCDGMTDAQIKERYRELVRAVSELQNTILCLVSAGGTAPVEVMPEPYRTKVRNLIAAYKD